MNARIEGMSHMKLEAGFSKAYGTPSCSHALNSRSDTCNSALPSRTFFLSAEFYIGKPQTWCSLRIGPRPKPSCLRARVSEVQGIPTHKHLIWPPWIKWRSVCPTWTCKIFCRGSMQISIGNGNRPFLRRHLVTRAVPANNSKQNFGGIDLIEKTSGHPKLVTASLGKSNLS
jgi:hypothetical protein